MPNHLNTGPGTPGGLVSLRRLSPEAYCVVDGILLTALARIIESDGPFWIISSLLGEYFDMRVDQAPTKEVHWNPKSV